MHAYLPLRIVAVCAVVLALASCATPVGRSAEPANLQVVSKTPTSTPPLAPQASPLPNLPPAPSRGDCAPRYANGLIGSCINGQPCRGFGVHDPRGGVQCPASIEAAVAS